MYVLRTTRRKVPVYQSENLEDVLEEYNRRVDIHGEGKYSIYDCIKEEEVDVENIKTRDFEYGDTELSEPVSEDSDNSLYEAVRYRTEPSSDSSD